MKSAVFFIFLLLVSAVVSAQEDFVVRKIKFTGNKQFSNSQLKDEITIESSYWFKEKIVGKEPVYYTKKLLAEDIKRLQIFYQREGFLDVRFGKPKITINKKRKVILTLPIEEGIPIRISDVSFLVDSTYTLQDVLKPIEQKKLVYQTQTTHSKIFRDNAIAEDKLLISEIFSNQGYPYTTVNQQLQVDTTTHTTKVNWLINRGPLSYFGSTSILGNSRVPTKSILRQISYKQGDLWSRKKVDQTQKQIYNQGNYRVASVRTIIDSVMVDTLPMHVQINEAPRWSTRFGVGYGREDKFRAFTELQYLSFITHTGRLNFFAKHSALEPYNIYFKFSQPSFLFPFNTLSINPFILRQNEPGFKLDRMGYNFSFLQNISEELNTSIGFVFEDVEQDTTDIDKVPKNIDEEVFYKKTGIVIGGIYNNSTPILDPIHGYSLSFNAKTNDIIFSHEMPFYRILTEFKTYVGLSQGTVLALKVKLGGIARTDKQSFIPNEERFYSGGSYSVRGWARSELGPKDENGKPIGGNSLFESSAEFRFDLNRQFKFTLFADAGNVWLNSFSYRLNDLHYSAGVGLKIKTPIGPAGIDFARPVFDEETSWQIHLNIGHAF